MHRGSLERLSAPLPAVSTATTTRIAVAGDTGTGAGTPIEGTVRAIVEQDRQHGYDVLVLLGDLIYPDGEAEQTRERIPDVLEPITSRGAHLIPVLDNHDYVSDEQADLLQLGREKSWYADQVGIARIIDTE